MRYSSQPAMDEAQHQTFSALPTAFFAASRLRAGGIILPYGSALLLASSILLSALPSAAAVITVGPVGADYTRVSDAIANADPNDEIQIATGLYVDDYATIEIPLTIIGVGATPVLQAVSSIPSGKGSMPTAGRSSEVPLRRPCRCADPQSRVPRCEGAGQQRRRYPAGSG